MEMFEVSVGGAGQFTGNAGAGLLSFPPIPNNGVYTVPVVHWVSYAEDQSANPPDVWCLLGDDWTTGSDYTMLFYVLSSEFPANKPINVMNQCRFPVPRNPALPNTFLPIRFFTLNKTNDGTVRAAWSFQSARGVLI